jgi:RNA polymerase sigma factor (sigma-70 family)
MAEAIQSNGPGAQAECFATTHWSVVLLADHSSSSAASGALEKLCRSYWYPVYSFVRRRGSSPHDAQDLTQEFFSRLLKRNSFADADPAKGRFRSFLLGALKHFLADEWDKAQAEKRGGHCEIFSLDALEPEARYALEPATDLTPERIFDRRWAATLLEHALRQLREEFTGAGKIRQFELLKPFLTNDAGPGGYDETAAQLETSPQTVAVSVHRLRQRYREAVRAEIAHTVTGPETIEEELRGLFALRRE